MEKLGIEVRFKVKVRARVSSMDGDEVIRAQSGLLIKNIYKSYDLILA